MTRPTPILQSEVAECGLACLAMITTAHGQATTLQDLRRRFPVALKGMKLRDLLEVAAGIGFSGRPLKLDLPFLAKLSLPCILHWDMNHFVVLARVRRGSVTVLDPAVGERRLSLDEVSAHFTGVAVELTPNADFKPAAPPPRVSLAALTGKVLGLRRSLVQILLVALVLELFAIVAPLCNQLIIDDVLTSGDRDLLKVLLIGFGLLLVTQTALGLARSWMLVLLTQTLSLQWRGNTFAHLLRLPVGFFERRHLGDITSRFGAVDAIQKTLTTAAIEALLDGLMGVAALVMMLIYAWPLALVVIAAVLLYGLLRWAAYRPLRDAAAERLVVAARESTHFLETLRAMTPLKLFGREQERRAQWQNLIVEVQNRDVRTAKLSMAMSTANTFLFGVENLLVLFLGAGLILDGQQAGTVTMTVGMLFAFLSYKGQFTGRVSALINYAVELRMLGLHAERLADIALEPPEPDEVPDHDLAHLEASLELRDVSFRYGEREPWILRHVNLTVPAGQSIAITGPSGSGKTTLLKVLLGLLAPEEGEVRYGGMPMRQLGLRNVRRQIGTVMQEDVLLTGSLADNIACFDTQPDPERVQAAAMLAQIHEDICRMPMGYQTLVGDLGSGLSGGQKQRVLLARAIYRRPRILALDEATSHLDVTRERAVTANLARLPLTRLMIAHRPDTIAGAERVIVLEGGAVDELPRPAGRDTLAT
ncbi:ATP-binding cassette subfamily B protein RaxB [Mitsuaria sp. BK045]|uniref:peptidase domain-containing ABC transporter n=1 Tax=unclassified Roseateles TaxID=2626991 RepID=UPI0016089806|nr:MULTISPECIES: peptidase domain-containing ABC transporter [unclassified Roseateles]MBB3291895.1 ATP-binding cassette subfamily B protein RaxB [Mitsuaria sp. BK041]MBB3361112.1 ATP-binding cassette subfamily B protein RaxB [Mitsuaria sp. BK045]